MLAQDRPDDLRFAYDTAMRVRPRWREHITNSLKRMGSAAKELTGL